MILIGYLKCNTIERGPLQSPSFSSSTRRKKLEGSGYEDLAMHRNARAHATAGEGRGGGRGGGDGKHTDR